MTAFAAARIGWVDGIAHLVRDEYMLDTRAREDFGLRDLLAAASARARSRRVMPVISGFSELAGLPWEHINDKIDRRVLAGKRGIERYSTSSRRRVRTFWLGEHPLTCVHPKDPIWLFWSTLF
jgi:hypothetical protein